MSHSQRDREIAIAQGAGKAKRSAGNAVHGLTHTEVLADFYKLQSDDARAAFARTWLSKSSEALNETWSVIYTLLKIVEEKELYKKESSLNNSKIYNSFQEFFEDTLKRPFEEWARLEADYNYVSQYCPELFNSFYSEVRTTPKNTNIDKKEREVILTMSEYESLKNRASQYKTIFHWEQLQQVVDNGWILSTAEVRELIGVKPRKSPFVRGAFQFTKCGKIGNQSAWSVEKIV